MHCLGFGVGIPGVVYFLLVSDGALDCVLVRDFSTSGGVRCKLRWRTAVPPTTDFDSSNGAAVFVIHKKGGELVGVRRGRSLPMSTSSKVTASCVTFDSAPMLP